MNRESAQDDWFLYTGAANYEADNPDSTAVYSDLYYIDKNFNGRIEHIQSLSLLRKEGKMCLDAFTIRNLEIFKSLSTQGIHGTLVETVDHTITGGGSRLLKNWLRQPLTNPEKINERLDRINECINSPGILKVIQSILKETSDLERIIGKVASGKANPRDIDRKSVV